MSKKNDAFKAWLTKWRDYVTTGRGKENAVFDDYEYRGDTVFSTRIPWMRLQCNEQGHWLQLVRTVKYDGNLISKGTNVSLPCIYLPCIGTFTPFPDDRMHGKELHDRMRYIMLNQTSWIATELIPATPAHLLAAQPRKGAYSHNREHLEKSDAWWIKRLETQYARYDFYRLHLAREWPPMPTYFRTDAEELMFKKVEKFHSEDEQAKRQRAKARRLANKALDLD